MKNKGFTLIELLAVIVVLAVIALIATPIVLNLVEKSRVGAAEQSATAYVKAVENGIMAKLIEDPSATVKGTFTVNSDGTKIVNSSGTEIEVDVKGDKPKAGGTIVIGDNGSVETAYLTINKYSVTYQEGESKVVEDTLKQTSFNVLQIFQSEYVDAGLIQEKTSWCDYSIGELISCIIYDPLTESRSDYTLSLENFLLKYDGPEIKRFKISFIVHDEGEMLITEDVSSAHVLFENKGYYVFPNGETLQY